MEQATLTVKIIKDDGFAEQLIKGFLTEAQQDVVRLITRQAVEEYVRQTKSVQRESNYNHPNRIIRLKEVITLTGLSRSTVYKLMNEQRFPSSIKLGPSSTGWRINDIQNWLDSRCSARSDLIS